MTHAEIAAHLRDEISNTAKYETGRLVIPHDAAPVWHSSPAFFGATRAVLSDIDYVAALWHGRNTPTEDRRQLATKEKTTRWVREVWARGSGIAGYATFATQLLDLYRHGTVHLRSPKVIRNPVTGDQVVWALMGGREDGIQTEAGLIESARHLEPVRLDTHLVALPVSVEALLEDFLKACEWLAREYEAEEAAGGTDMRDRWRTAADLLVTPEDAPNPAWWAPFP
jgi:hypothetical protein